MTVGTYRVRDQDTLDACVLEALKSGYRLIAPKDQGYDACHQAVLDSLKNLQLDYIDLYLIHWPGTAKLKLPDPQNAINRMESWHALEDLYHDRKLHAIGVSNYTLSHLSELIERPYKNHNSFDHPNNNTIGGIGASPPLSSTLGQQQQLQQQHHHQQQQSRGARTMVMPHVHQFELHPRLFQRELVEYCQTHRIQVQAYSSLGEGRLIVRSKFVDNVAASLDILPDLIQKYFPRPITQEDNGGNDITDPTTGIVGVGVGDGDVDDMNIGSMDLDTYPIIVETDDDDPAVYAQKAARILLRWGLQHGAVVIPKSSHPTRIKSNIDLFSFEIDPSNIMNFLEMKYQVKFTNVFKAPIQTLDKDLDQIQDAQFGFALVYDKDEIERRIMTIDHSRILPTQHLAPLQEIAYGVGSF
ncbi:hypothetical protein BG004_003905 [Podila humilis]|nr:hypothetical protein BG004_003905 [Podila humilis]